MADEQPTPALPQPQTTKSPWLSKTVWISVVMAASAFVPQVQAFIQANPELFAQVMGGVFLVLRLITKDKVSIS